MILVEFGKEDVMLIGDCNGRVGEMQLLELIEPENVLLKCANRFDSRL